MGNKRKYKEGALTEQEKPIVKRLLDDGWRGQDILALINIGRPKTTNSGRITGVKKDARQIPCSDEELRHFLKVQKAHDLRTGLNPYLHERLYRSREAMVLAVQLFNSPLHRFKSEIFSVLSNIAWTYLLHERLHFLKKPFLKPNGNTLSLSEMIELPDLNISASVKANLIDVKKLRDKVEHHTLQEADKLWLGLFQANCLNYDNLISEWFGEQTSLTHELAFSLQFAKANLEQLCSLNDYDIPADILAFNAEMRKAHSDQVVGDVEYEFSVFYTILSASKAKANVKFVSPGSVEAAEINNVLIKHRPADELYPYKPGKVVELVRAATGTEFSMHAHTTAWKKHKIRPEGQKPDAKKTNSKYCMFHAAHQDYTYNQEWVDLLVDENKK